jgi:hypothetical protein
MQYLQEVEKELAEGEFAEFLNIIEDFKSNRCLSGAVRLFPRCEVVPHAAPTSAHIPHGLPCCCRVHLRGRLACDAQLPRPARALPETSERASERASERVRGPSATTLLWPCWSWPWSPHRGSCCDIRFRLSTREVVTRVQKILSGKAKKI